mmetsp:Transcript_35054/g.49021  ORF Transcript_35054/g.49021 Transcript_35054/m.49021 type:complete len:215 (+) Transcript_35054:132-776(+)
MKFCCSNFASPSLSQSVFLVIAIASVAVSSLILGSKTLTASRINFATRARYALVAQTISAARIQTPIIGTSPYLSSSVNSIGSYCKAQQNPGLHTQRFNNMPTLEVSKAGEVDVNGQYKAKDPKEVPSGFAATCNKMMWDPSSTWNELSDQKKLWFEAENGSYIYWNRSDGRWWMDGPSGAGLYIVKNSNDLPPTSGWQALRGSKAPLPEIKLS